MYENDFYSRLSELRTQKKVSAREMSLALGQNPGYINHIENKQALPSLAVFFNICEFLEVSPEEFFASDAKKTALISDISENLKHLNPEQLYCLHYLIKDLIR